ncbi:hypothetical protein M3184_09460 [Metabacillus litoralis]|uniref:Uncharacterized protein n=1 Tax=Metabacillus rhizolycopersici TaxID=2875709 RepID=A0ABS7UTI2_9BACI|nr:MULTISPECIES: hypothetical protein [Metabacillus]MBZ5751519.1 hypothetical protein [Metabacillus rhizolycopersici]MCM3652069.1 hypothetical protein [Metabacillus litoralis]
MYKSILYLFFVVVVLTVFILTNFKDSFFAFL